MTYVITQLCERCGTCEEVCPSGAIHHVDDDPDWPTYTIHPENCIDCAACEADCNSDAIYYEDEVPPEYAGDVERNVEFYMSGPGKEMV